MTKLRPLVEKEVKDLLRDPRIYVGLLVPILILPVMGLAMSALQTSAEVVSRDLQISLLDNDGTEASNGFAQVLTSIGLEIARVSADSPDAALEEAKSLGSEALAIIPRGFEEQLLSFGKADVEVYSFVKSVGIGAIGVHSVIDGALTAYSGLLSNRLISQLNDQLDPEVIRNPLNVTRYTVIKDDVLEVPPEALVGQLLLSSIMVPVVLLMVAIMVTQVAATATAIENEEKTLETLLTFPLSRYNILLAKLLGSSVIAFLGGLLFTIGFLFYYQGAFMMPGLGEVMGGLGALPPPPPVAFAVLAVTLILSILFMTSLGIVIGALSSDVRMASSMLGIVIIPVLIPMMLVMYGDLEVLPIGLQLLAYALPTSYPMILAKEMITATLPIEVLYGIPYSALLSLVVIYLTSKMLAPEKLLSLQHKLKLRRTKKTKYADAE